MNTIRLDIWLYGPLARYGGSDDNIFAQVSPEMPLGSTVRDVLAHLQMPSEERGITFINGDLSAMPGLQPDLVHVLADGDRIAFFHLKSMWPFQYRHDVEMVGELKTEMANREDHGIRSRFDT
jgi:hypothetical protein